MKKYLNVNGDSGVIAYEIGENFIRVQFSDGSVYVYTNDVTGPNNIETMKRLARAGSGLNSFINTHVRKSYAHKER